MGGEEAVQHIVSELMPDEERHDGNVCEDSEELHAGLCYKRCSNLTNDEYPVRCSAFSCGKANPCFPDHEHAPSLIPGTGYDVNGQGGLPHRPGGCLSMRSTCLADASNNAKS